MTNLYSEIYSLIQSTNKATFRTALDVPRESLRNLPNGFVGIDGSGNIVGTFGSRVDTAANLASIVLLNGELAFASDTLDTFRGNGVAAGGLLVSGGKFYGTSASASSSTTSSATLTAPENVLTFPVVALGVYRYSVLVRFTDGSSTSNYGVVIDPGASAYGSIGGTTHSGYKHSKWGIDNSAVLMENAAILSTALGRYQSHVCPDITRGTMYNMMDGVFCAAAAGTGAIGVGSRTGTGSFGYIMSCDVQRIR